MPSGKQTSFQFGEVSPLNHYRSNDAAYSNALHSLHNMHVRRAGGISRIPGTKLLEIDPLQQDNTPSGEISYQRYKLFSYPFTDANGNRTMKRVTLHIKDPLTGIVTITIYSVGTLVDTSTRVEIGGGLENVKAVFAEEYMFIHGLKALVAPGTFKHAMFILYNLDTTPAITVVTAPELPIITNTITQGAKILTGGVLATAVQYLVIIELNDGREIPYKRFQTTNFDSLGFGITPVPLTEMTLPGDGVVMGFEFLVSLFGNVMKELKSVNIYRAPITGIDPSGKASLGNLVLVGKVPQDTTSWITAPVIDGALYSFTMNFVDTGASTPAITPPVDISMFTNWGSTKVLDGTSCSVVYQERHIIGFDSQSSLTPPGKMAVSKAGGILQIARPIIYRNIEAFQMSIPISDGSPVRQLIAADRILALSDKGSYIIQGGENGILTPTTINPIKISSEGGSKNVVPLVVGSSIVYLNSLHTKLMTVVFGQQYQAASAELSGLSDHLLDGSDFIEMHLMPGPDNIILLLKQNGSLVAVTINIQGVAGFASVDLGGGKVESMAETGLLTHSAIVMSVIRNGIRCIETLAYNRDENSLRTQVYSQFAFSYGDRLVKLTELGYAKIAALADTVADPSNSLRYGYLNITTGSDYDAGTTLSITVNEALPDPILAGRLIKVYYFDENNELQFIVLTALVDAVFGAGVWSFTARADIDVPAYLQNVQGNVALSAEEILVRTSHWLLAFDRVDATDYQTSIGALYASLAPGATIAPLVIPDGEVEVDVLAEGLVISAPLNPNKATMTIVKDGGFPYIEFPEPVTFVSVGISYDSYMQTLPIEVGEGRTLTDDKKIVDKVGIALYKTIGGYAGIPDVSLENMAPVITGDKIGEPDEEFSGYTSPIIPNEWSKDGMIKIIQVDPTPMTILSVYPKGQAGD